MPDSSDMGDLRSQDPARPTGDTVTGADLFEAKRVTLWPHGGGRELSTRCLDGWKRDLGREYVRGDLHDRALTMFAAAVLEVERLGGDHERIIRAGESA